MRPLLAGGRRAGVHGDVPLRRVHIRRPWRGTPAVVGGGAMGNHGGVATAVATIVAVLARRRGSAKGGDNGADNVLLE
jgi:hypothetical protein